MPGPSDFRPDASWPPWEHVLAVGAVIVLAVIVGVLRALGWVET